ncbi:MAG: DnaJ domain-containing protein [Ferruginibacter sp.]|nr:DnaJ domain-containing protein [Cytophagales bacterium]
MFFERLKNIIRSRLLTEVPFDQTGKDEWKEVEDYSDAKGNEQTSGAESFDAREAGYYTSLELKQDASFAEIKAAYKRLVKTYHPDKYANDEQKRKYAEQVTQKLNEAYAYLENKFGQK